MKVVEVAFFTYKNGQVEMMAWYENGKVVKRSAQDVAKLTKRTPEDIRRALEEMTLYKTREGSRVSGEWYRC